MQLFCFTFVGGSGSFFNGIEPYLRPEIELVKLEYAGHIERRHEPFYRYFDELTADMYVHVKAQVQVGEPYALFGYSMGAIAAADVTKMILKKGEISPPRHVFLASHGPRPVLGRAEHAGGETDETIKRWTLRFGGLPENLISSQTFWRIYLPIYRADYELITNYDYSRLDYVTDIPATVLFSPADIPYATVEKWNDIFTDECDILEFGGGHFFLREHERDVANVINERLKRYGV